MCWTILYTHKAVPLESGGSRSVPIMAVYGWMSKGVRDVGISCFLFVVKSLLSALRSYTA
mgnify:CR=1 FL=1